MLKSKQLCGVHFTFNRNILHFAIWTSKKYLCSVQNLSFVKHPNPSRTLAHKLDKACLVLRPFAIFSLKWKWPLKSDKVNFIVTCMFFYVFILKIFRMSFKKLRVLNLKVNFQWNLWALKIEVWLFLNSANNDYVTQLVVTLQFFLVKLVMLVLYRIDLNWKCTGPTLTPLIKTEPCSRVVLYP